MNRRLTPYLLMAPAAAVFAGLFLIPLAYFLVISFWQVRLYRLRPDFTLANYQEALADYTGVGLFTLALAIGAAALTAALGFVYAYVLRFKAGPFAPLLLFVALSTLFGGYLMKIYAWKTILGNEGVLNSALMSAGLIEQPIAALLYSPGAVVVTLTYFMLPLAVLPLYGAMRAIDDIEVEAARDLGAGPLTVLTTVIVPRCRLGFLTAFTLGFLIAAGDYVTPLLVGGKMTMIGNLIAPQFGQFFNWPLGAAMSFLVLAPALAVVLLANTLFARGSGR